MECTAMNKEKKKTGERAKLLDTRASIRDYKETRAGCGEKFRAGHERPVWFSTRGKKMSTVSYSGTNMHTG